MALSQHVVERKPFEKLSAKQRKFVEQYVLSGDAVHALAAAGYKQSRSSRFKASNLKSELRPYILKKTHEMVKSVDMAILGVKTCRDLAMNADSEAVRLQAAKELMTRALPEQPKEVTHNHTHTLRNLTEAEIDRRIARLAGDLAIDVSSSADDQSSAAG